MMSQNKIEAIIFDMDGTIVDTEETCAQVVKSSFSEWGREITLDDAYSLVGRKFDVALLYLMEKFPIDLSFDEALSVILTRYREKISQNVEVVPGVVESILELSSKFELGLVSGSHRIEILMILEQLKIKDYFKVILGAEDYPQSKPEPDGYNKAMDILAVPPSSVLVFEDSKAGLLSANSAGAWTVLVGHTQCSTKEKTLAHFYISDFNNVNSKWVKSLILSKKG